MNLKIVILYVVIFVVALAGITTFELSLYFASAAAYLAGQLSVLISMKIQKRI